MSTLLIGSTGKIGPHVARSLLVKGLTPRVLARNVEHARAVLPEGVEIVSGDHADISEALEGVKSALLLSEHGPPMAEAQLALLSQLNARGVRVIKASGTSAVIRPDGPDAGRQHWAVEEAVREAPAWVIVRPNAFMQTLVPTILASAEAGRIPDPLAGAGLSLVDCADIGAVLAEVLVNPEYDGRTLVLTGPGALSYGQIAKTIRDMGGPNADVVEVEVEAAAEAVRARGGSDWEAEHLAEMLRVFRAGGSAYVTNDIEEVLGRPPRSAVAFLADHFSAANVNGKEPKS